MGKLEGKVAVITGGSSGMALASAKLFVEEGAYVFITGRKQEQLDEAVKLIGRNVTGVRGDAANLDDLDRLFDTVKREKGKIDVLFASAGKGEAVPLGEITEQPFDAAFNVNARGTLFTVQKALPLLNDGASIIMTGSNASVKGFPGWGVYAASKAALRSFARTWLNELKGRKIRARPIRRGATLIVGAIAAILVLAFIFLVPALINVDRYRPQVISYLQETTGKQIEIGRLALTFFPVTIHIDHIGVKNPPIFPAGYVIQVARIDAELSVGALLHREVVIKSLVLQDPVLNLTSDPDGPWNFENRQSKISANPLPLGTISSVKIGRGLVIASNLLPSDKAGPIFFEAHEIYCELEQVNLVGIINPSSSAMDGQGSLKAGLLRFGAVEARNLRTL